MSILKQLNDSINNRPKEPSEFVLEGDALDNLDNLFETKRPSPQTLEFLSLLRQHPMVDKIVRLHGLATGSTALIRLKDGNAVEVQVHAAQDGDHHQDAR